MNQCELDYRSGSLYFCVLFALILITINIMKKILFYAFAMLLAAACYDDTALWDELKDHESRIVELETLCNKMNTNISSLQSIVTALQDKDYVTNVAPVKENGKEIGYVITFSKSGSITIYHGADGKDGANGQNGKDGADGKDGYTPVLGVKMDTDGAYYWTLDGEWLTDASGNKIPTTGKDGADGEDGTDGANGEDGKDGQDGTDGKDGQDGADGITPQLKIEESYWYISYDNGHTWERLGKAVGEDGKDGADGADGAVGADGEDGDSFFKSVTQDEENVYITLADGTEFVLPKAKQANVTIELNEIKDGTVTFIGNVQETSVDLKVTLYYSTSQNLTLYNYDGKVSVTDFDNKTFSLVLDGLTPATQYYYFTEVVFNGAIEYSKVGTFIITLANAGIYFFDDFSWIAPWADAHGSGDSVGDDNPFGTAPNVYTQASHQEYDGVGYVNGGAGVEGYPSFLTELSNRGYEDINAGDKVIYSQKYYLKFGKTKVPTGIKLPAMEFEGSEATDVVLSFDWSAQLNGRGIVDDIKIVVEIEGEGVCSDSQTKISNPISPDQEEGDLKWQNVKFLLKGVNNTTRITIRPTVLDNSDGVDQKRWYIDNIKVAKPKLVYSDDFEWIAPFAAVEGSGDAVGTDDPVASSRNVWKMDSSAEFFAKFNSIGYKYLYSTLGFTEYFPGPAQESNSAVGKDGSLYICANYLKFGQTSYNGALMLPPLSEIEGISDVLVEFDWCWQVTGHNRPDLMTLSVDATVGQFAATGTATSAPVESVQSTVDGESHLAWQHASIVLNGATPETILTIRPTEADPSVQNPLRHQNRWYLDNIQVISLN